MISAGMFCWNITGPGTELISDSGFLVAGFRFMVSRFGMLILFQGEWRFVHVFGIGAYEYFVVAGFGHPF